jgi:hypothetical protein
MIEIRLVLGSMVIWLNGEMDWHYVMLSSFHAVFNGE